MNRERFHLTLYSGDRAAAHGWWGSEVVARAKFASWIGAWGRDGTSIRLVDEETRTTLDEWPGVVGPPS